MINIKGLPYEKEEAFNKLNASNQYSFINLKQEINDSCLEGSIQTMRFDGIYFQHICLDIKNTEERLFLIPNKSVFLCFVLEGISELKVNDNRVYHMKPGMHNIFYFPKCSGYVKANQGYHNLILLRIPLKDFKNYLPTDQHIFCRFRSEISEGKTSCLRRENGVMTHQIYQIIEDLCQSNPEEEVKRLFIKAKVFELLSVQLQNLCFFCPTSVIINRQIVEKMYDAKNFMIENLEGYYSLKDLAKKVGTNEYTLKKEFKELFGDTVFGFWNKLKMDKAKELLMQQEKTIAEISEIVGYKNPQHFSTAFKRKFKIPPSVFRKNYK